jgi:hypothetical protein
MVVAVLTTSNEQKLVLPLLSAWYLWPAPMSEVGKD